MGLFERTLLILYSFLMSLLFVIFTATIIFEWRTPYNFLDIALVNETQRNIIGLLAIILLLLSLYFLVYSIRFKREPDQAIIQETELGQVRIALDALENLVRRTALQVRGIREVKPRVRNTEEGVNIFIQAVVSPDLSIPQVTEEIQSRVKDYVFDIAGISVNKVKILVDNISSEVRARVE